MRHLHVQIQDDNNWLIALAIEEPSVITQGRTLDEIVNNVREVVQLMFNEPHANLELLVPPGILGRKRQHHRRTGKRRISTVK
jgi:predicted RNase H-like HicB family nuclease